MLVSRFRVSGIVKVVYTVFKRMSANGEGITAAIVPDAAKTNAIEFMLGEQSLDSFVNKRVTLEIVSV